jgi:hypothetical protein
MPDIPETAPDRYVAQQARNCDCFEVRDTQTDTAVFGCTAMTEHIANVVARQMSGAYRKATSARLSPPAHDPHSGHPHAARTQDTA